MGRKIVFVLMLLIMGTVFITGCSFLYKDPSASTSQSIIDVFTAEEPWIVPLMTGEDHNGMEWSTEDMDGQWWITKIVFTRCPTVCMTMTPNMVQLQKEMNNEGLEVQIISFTADPEFDTPERLNTYGEAYGASLDNWSFITGYTQEEIEDFSYEALKQRVMKLPEHNDIMHPVGFYLVNPQGQIVRIYKGEEGFDLKAYINDLKTLLN